MLLTLSLIALIHFMFKLAGELHYIFDSSISSASFWITIYEAQLFFDNENCFGLNMFGVANYLIK